MQLVFSNPFRTFTNSYISGDIILSLRITIWFCWRNVKKGVHLEEIELGWRIILKRIFKFKYEKFKWIGVSQDRDNGIAFVNTVMNIWLHKTRREFFDYMRK
jgi:hypothetical protein